MLTVIKLNDAEYTLTQVAEGLEEYYLGQGEAPGVWAGRWAGELGLDGVVVGDDLRALLDGLRPGGGEDLLSGLRERTHKAFDATFSPPKSVSLLWAFASPEVTSAVTRAHVEAVMGALGVLEGKVAVARQQTGGIRVRVGTHGLAVATFFHRTSRDGDPQIHTHCVIPNLVQRPDGTCVALDGSALYEWKKAVGSVYQEQLRRILTERLGVEWGPDRNGTREMVGFTTTQLRQFSKRTTKIEALLEEWGVDGDDREAAMRADEAASMRTRTKKNKTLTPALLRGRWDTEAAEVGMPVGDALSQLVCGRVVGRDGIDRHQVFSHLIDGEVGLCARRARFSEPHVVEAIAALGAGQLTVTQITALTADFLASNHVVRLVDVDQPARHGPRWTTAAHLQLEHQVLDGLATLHHTTVPGPGQAAIDHAIAAAPHLGDDQAAAVRALCEPGPALRALVAPPGFGKTTTVTAATAAVRAAGCPVLAVATTNQAVNQLREAGLDACTLTRLRLDLADTRLPAGVVVIVDEISQVATADAAWLTAAVAATAGGQLWCLGDHKQGRAVRAGGLAGEINHLITQGQLRVGHLTVNRRQLNPAEQHALHLHRQGRAADSQAVRNQHGWEHDHGTPDATRQAMAQAVAADINRHGAPNVAALAVSHADCEDIADRIRQVLTGESVIGGPTMTGTGWGARSRCYQGGDRILLHCSFQGGDVRLHNGTVVTATNVVDNGISVVDPAGRKLLLPRELVEGCRIDGAPNVSHGWCRTIDGAQGATFTQVHLLAGNNLDAGTGYVGQSRGRLPTHTWNLTPFDLGDHGGQQVPERDGAEETLSALQRQPDNRFAADSDPWRLDRQLTNERAQHQIIINNRPPDVAAALAPAKAAVDRAADTLAQAEMRLRLRHDELDRIGPLTRLRRGGRQQTARTEHAVDHAAVEVDTDRALLRQRQVDYDRLADTAQRRQAWDRQHGWRTARVADIDHELAEHWTSAVLAAVAEGDPLAFGTDKLRDAYHHVNDLRQRIALSAPPDRSSQLAHADQTVNHRRQLVDHAQKGLRTAENNLDQAGTLRWGRRDAQHVAGRDVAAGQRDVNEATKQLDVAQRALAAERTAEAERARTIAGTEPRRRQLDQAAKTLGHAVRQARTNRVIAAANSQPGRHPLHDTLGPPPPGAPARAVWCGLADRIETERDRHRDPAPEGSDRDLARRAYRLAQGPNDLDRLIDNAPEIINAANGGRDGARTPDDPEDWGAALDEAVAARQRQLGRSISRGMELGL